MPPITGSDEALGAFWMDIASARHSVRYERPPKPNAAPQRRRAERSTTAATDLRVCTCNVLVYTPAIIESYCSAQRGD